MRIVISIFCLTHIDTNDEKRTHPEEDSEDNAFKNKEKKRKKRAMLLYKCFKQ
jgi:hypothetical protein